MHTKIIVFEGVDRSGKDTIIDQVKTELENQGLSVGVYRNPDHPVRDMLLSSKTTLNERENLLCFYAGYLHTDRQIMLDGYDVALVNRRILSSLVYQKFNTYIFKQQLEALNTYQPLNEVEMIVFLTLSDKELINRCNNVELDGSRFEESNQMILRRKGIYQEFVSQASKEMNHLFDWDKIYSYINDNFEQQERIVQTIKKMIVND